MKPPNSETVLKALDYFNKGDDFAHRPEAQTVLDAALAWSRIAPDADDEWDDEVVAHLARAMDREVGNPSPVLAEDYWNRWRGVTKTVLAELVRLAEGNDK